LNPNGNFGNRMMGGKNSASPRYIYTQLNSLIPSIIRKEDEIILDYQIEDNKKIEPVTYYPILPIVLVNGASGIGTGFSTNIPTYNPIDIVNNLKLLLRGKQMKKLEPWYRGFTGTINKLSKTSYETVGKHEIINSRTIRITELPIGIWTNKYKMYLESLIRTDLNDRNDKKIISNIINHCSNSTVDLTITFVEDALQKLIKKDILEKKLKLGTQINISNMHLYDEDKNIKRYELPEDILSQFFDLRLNIYKKRKDKFLEILEHEYNILKYKVKFINYVVKDKIVIKKKKRQYIINKLEHYDFPKLSVKMGSEVSYDYLTSMSLFSLTYEKMNELKNEMDNKLKEIDIYKNTTCHELWNKELDEFLVTYKKWLKDTIKQNPTKKSIRRPAKSSRSTRSSRSKRK
jgi:DNA topoisomerase-2